ncbi:MAG: type II secretion system protein [Acidobacteriota bacterium]
MRKLNGQKGLSLIEVTIMLLVLMLLTSVLVPSIFDFIKDAQRVKVKEDCEAIAVSIARLFRDTNCVAQNGSAVPVDCEILNIAGILYSDGNEPSIDLVDAPNFTPAGSTAECATYNWDDPFDAAPCAAFDTLESQLVRNDPAYKTPGALGFAQNPLPLFTTGWRGAYLAPPIGPDPWGSTYLVNTLFLRVANDANCSGDQGCPDYGWHYDTICLSAGEDQTIETPFAGSGGGTQRGGDDFVTVISGGSR